MNFRLLILFGAMTILMGSCGGASKGDMLERAAAKADSIAKAEGGGSAVLDSPDICVDFTVNDTLIPLQMITQDLFDVFASQQLKKIPQKDVSAVTDALRENNGELKVTLNSPKGESVTFEFAPRRVTTLQKARNSELNVSGARTAVIDIARQMIPAPEAHKGASDIVTSVTKSFLEYDIIWPKASDFARYPQGILTKNYFTPLKMQYQAMGSLAEPVIEMLESMGIDGIRIVYSAADSDKQLKQAFPWREIRLPIEPTTKK